MSLSNINVDIIVPIYNAYEYLKACVDSLILYTDLTYNRILLLNDCSTDERVKDYLNTIQQDHIIVIHNESNLGFSANINKGISMSENDVVFLNSDTVVTYNWLEKLQNCAYADETIATVTPLSNSATICSVPSFCEDNVLPPEISIDDMAELVESCSMKQYPTIPVAHGFCMYVKRSVLNVVGNLNAEVFQRGYGEENDFCFRAEELGFHHMMCDDTFIYHAGTASFVSQDKKKLIQEHNKYLFSNYPSQMRNVENYCKGNPNHIIQDNIELRLQILQILKNQRKTILYQVQSDFREGTFDAIGGTQLHVKDLTEGLQNKYNIVVAARDEKWLNVTLYSDEKEVRLRFFIGMAVDYMPFRSVKFRKIYDHILELFRIDLIHIHHVIGLTLELYYAGEAAGIPVITTLHDFYYLCPSIKMLDMSNKLCLYEDGQERCADCLRKRKNIMPSLDYIRIWRQEHLYGLKLSGTIIVPSESTKEIFLRYYPELNGKIIVIGHGLKKFPAVHEISKFRKTNTFNIAFLGGVGSPAKGGDIICQMIKHGSKNIHWYVFGIMGHCDLGMLQQDNYTKIGQYKREDLPELMQKYEIDLVGILPIWPETFCYTLSESVLCGVPVIASDIGAISERIHKHLCGWIVEQNSSWKDILDKIEYIRLHSEEYQKVKAELKNVPVETIEMMLNRYIDVYQSQPERNYNSPNIRFDNRFIVNAWLSTQGKNYEDDENYQRLEQAEMDLQNIKNSTAYKISIRMSQLKIPFKRQLKYLAYKMYNAIRR